MDDGSIATEDAIADLERLRFAWRGDAFEFALLTRLADLYVDTGKYRNALHALRQAASHFPQSKRSQEVVQKMREVFAGLYLADSGVVVPPIKALAIYDEFKELTPLGKDGDRLITHLADRLVEVDLLDRAADLLDGQVRYRLEGEEKARIGARLALIRLLNREPQETLAVLDVSRVELLPDDLRLQRRHLRVRALSELKRDEDALALLKDDSTADAIRLRADILWNRRDWAGASRALSRLVPPSPPDRPLNEVESRTITNLAIALTLAGGRGRLISLNKRYKTAMAETAHRETFKLLAGDIDPSTNRTIADELKSIAPAQAFMTSYRDRLQNGPLSAIN